jgi:hypothetical protein
MLSGGELNQRRPISGALTVFLSIFNVSLVLSLRSKPLENLGSCQHCFALGTAGRDTWSVAALDLVFLYDQCRPSGASRFYIDYPGLTPWANFWSRLPRFENRYSFIWSRLRRFENRYSFIVAGKMAPVFSKTPAVADNI